MSTTTSTRARKRATTLMALHRKAEKAERSYFEDSGRLRAVQFMSGSEAESADSIKLPVIIFYGENQLEVEGMPQDTGVRNVTLRVQHIASAKDTTRATADDQIERTMDLMLDVSTMQTALNKPSSGGDGRAVKNFHVYDSLLSNVVQDRQDDKWITDLVFSLICGAHDA